MVITCDERCCLYCIPLRALLRQGMRATHWSGNPAPGLIVKWSSIRKGEKLRSCGVPIDLRTRAPAPSDCSMAKKAFRIARGIVIFADFGAPYICTAGNTGSPRKPAAVLLEMWLLTDSSCARSVSLYATDRNATMIETRMKRNFIRSEALFIEKQQRSVRNVRLSEGSSR